MKFSLKLYMLALKIENETCSNDRIFYLGIKCYFHQSILPSVLICVSYNIVTVFKGCRYLDVMLCLCLEPMPKELTVIITRILL